MEFWAQCDRWGITVGNTTADIHAMQAVAECTLLLIDREAQALNRAASKRPQASTAAKCALKSCMFQLIHAPGVGVKQGCVCLLRMLQLLRFCHCRISAQLLGSTHVVLANLKMDECCVCADVMAVACRQQWSKAQSRRHAANLTQKVGRRCVAAVRFGEQCLHLFTFAISQ